MISFMIITILFCAFLSGTVKMILEQVYMGSWHKIPEIIGMGCITTSLLLQLIHLLLLL